MSGENWFSFSEDSGFQRHASAEDARACAQRALDYDESEAGCDGWPEGTDRICWGEVREAAVGTVTHRHGPDCRPDSSNDEDDTCTEGYSVLFDRICEFNMTPTVPPSEIDTLRARAEAAEAEVKHLRAELAQARADRALLAGLWLIVVHHDVLPALLPTDQGDRDRLAAALDAVDRQPGAEARIAAGRAVIARIVAETGGGAA